MLQLLNSKSAVNWIPKTFTVALMAVFFLAGSGFSADKYEIDLAHSSIGFTVKHMVLAKVRGGFRYFIDLQFDDEKIRKSTVTTTIKTASIYTDNEKRDTHLKSADFFDVEKYPEITFMSKSIKKKDLQFVLVGDLTMRGVTKEVRIPFTLLGKIKDPMGNVRVGFEGHLTLNRQDYGISWSKTMDAGGLVVGNEVEIELIIEAIKK